MKSKAKGIIAGSTKQLRKSLQTESIQRRRLQIFLRPLTTPYQVLPLRSWSGHHLCVGPCKETKYVSHSLPEVLCNKSQPLDS